MSRWGERAAALGLGALAGAAWQPLNWWPVVFVALAGLSALLWRRERRLRQGFALGWWFGLGMGVVSLGWVGVIGWYVVPPLLCFMALWQALVGLGTVAAGRLTANPLLRAVLAACCWSLAEYGASRVPFGGFGWMRLAYTQVDSPLAGWFPLLGVGGVSLLVALLANLLLVVVAQLAPGAFRTARRRAGLAGALALALAAGVGAPLAGRIGPGPQQGSVNVGMVQGNVDGSAGPHAMGYARSVTDNHVSETVMLMARARAGLDPLPDFVLWPENSTDVDPTLDAETASLVGRASAVAGLPILVGAVMAGPGIDERQTSALWWPTSQLPTARYDKRNLVPFGEWIPLRDQLLPLLPILQEIGPQSVPGTGPGVLHVTLGDGRQIALGDIICFELAWDATVHDTVTHGAQLLVVQSNNGTYTGTGQPRQQFAITRARAMEMRREIVVATTNSLSGLVHPDGSVTGLTTEGTAAAQTFTTPLRTGTTPAVRVGPAVELAASLVALAMLGAALVLPRLRRRRAAGSSTAR